jgi:hypothetical protein
MDYKLAIETKNDVLWVKATGTRSRETVLDMSGDVLEACVKERVKKVLIDVRELQGRLLPKDSYDIAAKHFPKIRDPNVITQAALVDLEEFRDQYRFFENVAVNRGFNLRIFPNVEDALQWLAK